MLSGHLELSHDLTGVAGGGANLHSELLSQPGNCLSNSLRISSVSNQRRHLAVLTETPPLMTVELAGRTSRVADRDLLYILSASSAVGGEPEHHH